MHFYGEIRKHLATLEHKDKVAFALYCAKSLLKFNDITTLALDRDAIDITERWLKGEDISKEDLFNAVNAVNAAAREETIEQLYNVLINGKYKIKKIKKTPKEKL